MGAGGVQGLLGCPMGAGSVLSLLAIKCGVESLLNLYLGLPLGHPKNSTEIWNVVVDKFQYPCDNGYKEVTVLPSRDIVYDQVKQLIGLRHKPITLQDALLRSDTQPSLSAKAGPVVFQCILALKEQIFKDYAQLNSRPLPGSSIASEFGWLKFNVNGAFGEVLALPRLEAS
ncbi:hypothetical protein GQ457_03G013490 [Hibiscus cannabinus]